MTNKIRFNQFSNGAFISDENCTIFIGRKEVVVGDNHKHLYYWLSLTEYHNITKQLSHNFTPSLVLWTIKEEEIKEWDEMLPLEYPEETTKHHSLDITIPEWEDLVDKRWP